MNTDAWVIENIVLGNRSYNIVEAVAILDSEDPSPIERLMAAFFSTLLNTLNGADSTEIDPAVVEARDWMILRPHGIDLSEAEILQIENLTNQLKDYNNGLTGPGLCEDDPTAPTPGMTSTTVSPEEITATAIPEPTTATPTQEITSTQPATGTTAPGATLPRPTATATKDNDGGSKPKPTKTSPPPPPPDTQPPPPPDTQPPPPPDTQPPPPTPAPTQPPAPTQSP
jgi:hypothetical protein